MATFTIHALSAKTGEQTTFSYNNMTSELLHADGSPVVPVRPEPRAPITAVAAQQPGRKGTIRRLKISLGLSCNYECSYCSQRFVPHADSTNPDDIEPFLRELQDAMIDPPERIEFWGGEPLVYWKTFKPLAERIHELYPHAELKVITNGSLLDAEKNKWLDDMGFVVGLSHDGPGYHARGVDPLDDPEKRAAIMDLYQRLAPQKRMSINAMLHSSSKSRVAVQQWLKERFGDDVVIGEGDMIDPYDEGGVAASMPADAAAEHIAYRQNAFREIRTGAVDNFGVVHQKISGFIKSIQTARPASALGQKCGMDRSDNLAVDLHGNVITCQNVSAAATAPNGQPHKIGHLSNLSAVRLRSATHWSQRKDCASCPVLHLCQGSCMFLEGPLWETGCASAYSDNIPYLAAAIEYLTGYLPFYIDGDFRADRKDIFGQLTQAKPAPKVIPIKAM